MGLSWLRQRDLVLVLVLVMVTSSAIELNGDNVCHRVENYTVPVRESYTEPVFVNTVTWCLQIPPRCPRSRVEMRERWRIKTETRQRKLMACCEGYVVKTISGKDTNVEDTGVCEPHCEICEYGRCVAPNTCECEPGHRGDGCAYECPAGMWGVRCSRICNCQSVEVCNPVDGKCHCPPGWRGSGCKDKCPLGQWGLDCALPCACNNEKNDNKSSVLGTRKLSSLCHHETGICIDFDRSIVPFIAGTDRSSGGKNSDESATSIATTAIVPSTTTKLMPIDRIESTTSISDYDNHDTDEEFEDDDDVDPQGDRVATRLPRPNEREIDYDQPEASSARNGGSLSEISPNPVVLEINAIETSSIATSTGTNKNGNYNGQQRVGRIDTKVPRVKKPSTPGPIVAVVHVSGNGSPGHDGSMIMTSLGAEKIPTHAVPMPLDVAALIVVGSIISLGLTTLAVLAVLHIRSRLFETIRLSIYDATEKRDATTNGTIRHGAGEKGNNGRISSMGCNSGIIACEYETPRCIVPEHQTLPRPRPASCAETAKKQESSYSNDFANIRLFSNIQELLEAHYDRPPSTFRHAVLDVDGEHVYDEIPLQSSTTFATKRDS